MNYLLDTDTVSFAIRGDGKVASEIRERLPSEIAISSITYAELVSGAERKASIRLAASVRNFVSQISILPFDRDAAEEFGKISALLIKQGLPIGNMDTLIAAHAIASEHVLVTNNTKHFSRVPNLRIENWY